MNTRQFALLALACASTPGHAADAVRPRAEYVLEKGPQYMSLEVKPVKGGKNRFEIDVYVGHPGCAGDFHGTGTLVGNKLIARDPEPVADDLICSVEVEFNADGSQARTKETNCRDHHGGACNFDGKLTAK